MGHSARALVGREIPPSSLSRGADGGVIPARMEVVRIAAFFGLLATVTDQTEAAEGGEGNED